MDKILINYIPKDIVAYEIIPYLTISEHNVIKIKEKLLRNLESGITIFRINNFLSTNHQFPAMEEYACWQIKKNKIKSPGLRQLLE